MNQRPIYCVNNAIALHLVAISHFQNNRLNFFTRYATLQTRTQFQLHIRLHSELIGNWYALDAHFLFFFFFASIGVRI